MSGVLSGEKVLTRRNPPTCEKCGADRTGCWCCGGCGSLDRTVCGCRLPREDEPGAPYQEAQAE